MHIAVYDCTFTVNQKKFPVDYILQMFSVKKETETVTLSKQEH